MKTTKFKVGDLIRPKKGISSIYCPPGIYLRVADTWEDDGTEYPGYFLTVSGDGTFHPFYKQWADKYMELVSV